MKLVLTLNTSEYVKLYRSHVYEYVYCAYLQYGYLQLGLNFLWVSSFIYYIRLDNFRGEIGDA